MPDSLVRVIHMVSMKHEGLLALFRNRPTLAPELLQEVLGVEIPPWSEARVESAEFTQVVPTEDRACLVRCQEGCLEADGRKIVAFSNPQERKDATIDRRDRRRWMSLLAGCAMLATTQLPVAHAEPPLTKAPGCVKRGWPATVTCGSTVCFVSSCGDGKCPYCFIEGMENLAIKGWAVYTCMKGESVTGKALLFHTLPFNARLGPFCA